MRKLLVVLSLSLVGSSQCFAKAASNMLPAESYVFGAVGAYGGNSEAKLGLIGGGGIGTQTKYFGLSAGVLRYSQTNNVSQLSQGDVSLTPVMFNAYFRVPSTGKLSARFGGGFSYVFASHNLESSFRNRVHDVGFGIQETIDDGIGFQLTGGADYRVSKRWSVGFDLTQLYLWSEATATAYSLATNESRTVRGNVNLSSFIGTANIKYHF